jgi:SAM-dependent methyltransferase
MLAENKYSGEFYTERRQRTLVSARRTLELVAEVAPFRSVVDVGCGTGTWLSVAGELGASRLVGYEGTWVSKEMMDEPAASLILGDLGQPLRVEETFNLAISLEVAEHLPLERADSFVGELCALAPVTLFSAAIPGQGGRGHVNEQWQSYWADLFARNGRVPVDLVRPKLWIDDAVPFFYRQNILLYCRPDDARRIARVTNCAIGEDVLIDIVHPIQFERLAREKSRSGKKKSHLRKMTKKYFRALKNLG